MNRSDVSDAAVLVRHALTATRPRDGSPYRALLDRYRTDTDFAETVRVVAEGLGLYVGALSPLGLLLTGDSDGPFKVSVDNCGLRLRSTSAGKLTDRRCFGLVLVAVAAYAYPNGEALVEATNRPVRAVEIERFLDRRIEAVVAASDSGALQDDLDVQLSEAARVWRDLPQIHHSDKGRLVRECHRSYVEDTLEFLVEAGRAQKQPALADERGEVFVLNDRFRLGLADTAEGAVFALLAAEVA